MLGPVARLKDWWARNQWRLNPTWDPRCTPCLEGAGEQHACLDGRQCGCEERKCHKPVIIEYVSRPPLPKLETYIASCCREYIAPIGYPGGRCVHCGERPTWLRPDKEFKLDFPIDGWQLRTGYGESWTQLDGRHLARTPTHPFQRDLVVMHWCVASGPEDSGAWVNWSFVDLALARNTDVLHVDRHLDFGCCGDSGWIKHGRWESTTKAVPEPAAECDKLLTSR